MTGKSGKREILWKKYRRGRNEENGIPLYAMPGHSPHSQSVAIAGRPITVLHDAKLCAIARYSSHITCAIARCSSHMHFRAMTDHAILLARGALSEIRHNVCEISASRPSGTMRFPQSSVITVTLHHFTVSHTFTQSSHNLCPRCLPDDTILGSVPTMLRTTVRPVRYAALNLRSQTQAYL